MNKQSTYAHINGYILQICGFLDHAMPHQLFFFSRPEEGGQ